MRKKLTMGARQDEHHKGVQSGRTPLQRDLSRISPRSPSYRPAGRKAQIIRS
jgi:hypothetical protein